jgi:hypothetical protein
VIWLRVLIQVVSFMVHLVLMRPQTVGDVNQLSKGVSEYQHG